MGRPVNNDGPPLKETCEQVLWPLRHPTSSPPSLSTRWPTTPSPDIIDGEEEFEVDCIVKLRHIFLYTFCSFCSTLHTRDSHSYSRPRDTITLYLPTPLSPFIGALPPGSLSLAFSLFLTQAIQLNGVHEGGLRDAFQVLQHQVCLGKPWLLRLLTSSVLFYAAALPYLFNTSVWVFYYYVT